MVLGFVVPWVVFVRVAREVWAGEGLPGDERILKFLHAHATPALDTLAVGPGRWPAGDLPAGCDHQRGAGLAAPRLHWGKARKAVRAAWLSCCSF